MMVALCTSATAVKPVVSAFVLLVLVVCNISIDAFITTAFCGVRFQPKGPKLTARLAVTGVNHDKINSHIGGRRDTMKQVAIILGLLTVKESAYALDMDAFIKSEIEKDSKDCNPKVDPKCQPTMSQDEALCKYGQSGAARGEACQRFKEKGGNLPVKTKEKSLGGAYAM